MSDITAPLRIEAVVSALFDQNAYVIWRDGQSAALVVDPGFDSDALLRFLHRRELLPAAILNTHGHADHIAGNAAVLGNAPGIPLAIGRNDAHMLSDAMANLSAQFGFPFVSPPADRLVDDGERLEIAGISMLVREIPGHSPGSVVFILEGDTPMRIIGGDVLFSGSVGRTDFPGGSFPTLFEGIREKLFPLPDDAIVYPGHGPSTTIGHERRTNPYVGERATGQS